MINIFSISILLYCYTAVSPYYCIAVPLYLRIATYIATMDMLLVMQILFTNEKAFEDISDSKKCEVIASVCREAKENEHIQSVISKNRAEVYPVRIFNCLLKQVPKSKNCSVDMGMDGIDGMDPKTKEFSRKLTESISNMLSKQTEQFRVYFTEFILLDYIEIINNNLRYNAGFENGYYDYRLVHPFILYNYKAIIKILEIDFEKELISLKVRKIEEFNNSWEKIGIMLWNIENILEIHNKK